MNRLISVIAVLLCALYSCTVEDNSDSNTLNFVDLNAADKKSNNRISIRTICQSIALYNEQSEVVGSAAFSVLESDVQVDLNINPELKLSHSSLYIESWNLENQNPNEYYVPVAEKFPYQSEHEGDISSYSYSIDKSELGESCRFSVYIQATDLNGQPIDIWAGKWSSFMQADFSSCGDWPDDTEICMDFSDIEFYAPLTEGNSGTYPDFGLSSDTVSLNPDNPFTEGYIDLPIHISDIPIGYNSATISMSFDDLDLHEDIITSGGNTINFRESFYLIDQFGKILVELNSNHSEDGDFTFSYDLPNYIFNNIENVTLYARVTAHLELVDGNGFTTQNTIERISDISICGKTIIK